MLEYKELKDRGLVPGKILSDLNLIISIFRHYDKKIMYRIDRYFVEFIFVDIKFTKDKWINIYKIFLRTRNTVRLGKSNNKDLIVVIERFQNVFIDDIK